MSASIEAIYGLTPLQEGMLMQKMTNHNDTSYHIQNSFFMNSECDKKKQKKKKNLFFR